MIGLPKLHSEERIRISAKPQRIVIVSIHHRLSLVSVAHRGRAALYRSQLVSWSTVILALLATCPHIPEIGAALILRSSMANEFAF